MMKSKTARFGAFLATLGMSAGLVGTAVHSTGAYFSDTKSGAITGTMGSIKVTTYGGTGADNTNFSFANMLPDEPQTATVQYQNTGRNAEDVWLVFTDSSAVAAVNDLGHYGTAKISSNGVDLFNSVNLKGLPSCPPVDANGPTDCSPLPTQQKLIDNLAAGSGVQSMGFTFGYAGGTKTLGNTFNVDGATGPTALNLPYQIVAVQHGQVPA